MVVKRHCPQEVSVSPPLSLLVSTLELSRLESSFFNERMQVIGIVQPLVLRFNPTTVHLIPIVQDPVDYGCARNLNVGDGRWETTLGIFERRETAADQQSDISLRIGLLWSEESVGCEPRCGLMILELLLTRLGLAAVDRNHWLFA